MTKFLVIAGHDQSRDPGAVAFGRKEADITVDFRDRLVAEFARITKMLRLNHALFTAEGTTMTDADDLNLAQTIAWANQAGEGHDLLLDIHVNAAASPDATGFEVYHADHTSEKNKSRGNRLLKAISQVIPLPNRGLRAESQSAVGSLGILNQTTPQALLLELFFLTNASDLATYDSLIDKYVHAVALFYVGEIYGAHYEASNA